MATNDSRIRPVALRALASLIAASAMLAAVTLAQDARRDASASRLERPQDIESWIAVGVTLRMQAANPAQPGEFRLIRMEPEAYRHVQRTGSFKDGTMLAATFHGLQFDDTHAPPLYAATNERALALEVIDARRPDGRRFYVFAGDAATAEELPQGNACAACHNARGSFKGTFAALYPALSRLVRGAAQDPPTQRRQ